MAPEPHSVPDTARPPCATIRATVHAAFDHVALSLSCTLESLLQETRTRGLLDDDVRKILEVDEAESLGGHDSDMHLLCYRSNAGVVYVTRDTAAENEPVSTTTAFASQSQPNSPE